MIWNSAKWNVNPNQNIDTFWSYDVVVNSGAKRIRDASMELLSYAIDNGGDIHITETLKDILNNVIASVPPGPLSVDALIGPQTDHHVFLQNYAFLTVNKDVSLEGHDGSASLSTFKQNFSQVPEPATLPLLGGALVAFAFASRKLSRKPNCDIAG